MNNTKLSSRILAFAASLVFGLGVFAAPSLAKDASDKPAAVPSTIDWKSLDLSSEQIKKINILRLEFNKKAIVLKAEAQQKQEEIQRLLMSPASNPNLVRRLLQEKLALESKLKAESLDHFLAIRKLLSPEQLVLLKQQLVSLK
ncbi:hypothetical protein COW36_13745 [bacterium (Candidatus Blackallbacteria) CG17_big_fil_post_rev_8_21_14_2_50_48_46]|uniref:Periplasmic heavy metal sensor n=1 Tax=bacterium (Candidatus Blackallbacteria) CG17_big_fil_post_rev_8_21_14_2_50_48_46 TaxID=2014261 RepID=A0A2M7G2Z2_9BACT|nr:MAG: hypothetical protein COW64_23220 [bacterium (Candidatus Blackallbacteria) CG18_big_fil_WC_8_21_14_2_50_49_26]PIW16191.1 MAG: hypothetical protein COW36_13745 [bacterium (Candidatus Blackallbacteria) CG17_big_fil_post_rev_8_21_14_2_50_48_46]PIW49926.1 MAG: hypothetical protein COW20_04560 [bacterium (Candidatus Blackallbacteria) CG13_big_fil_rev_8_21_14_2_50_49_14]